MSPWATVPVSVEFPGASPAPTGGIGVRDALPGKTVINIAGCPPIAEAITNTFAYVLVYDRYPRLDELGRPTFVYGNTIHDRCIRRSFYDAGKYAMGFDDVKARDGYCLYMLGCKGPTTYNACPTLRWNGGVSYPIQSGHPCLGCSEPHFWDRGSFYAGQSAPLASPSGTIAAIAVGAGAAVGVGSALLARALSAKKEEKEEKPMGNELLAFARGPLFYACLTFFLFAMAFRLFRILLMRWQKDRAKPKGSAGWGR